MWFPVVSSAAFSVSGVVVDEGGAPLAGAMITLMPGSQPEMPFPFLMGVADRNGAFTLGGVLPGDYFVIANPSVESSFGGAGGGFSIGFGVEAVADSEPVVVFDTLFRAPADQDSRHERQRHGPENSRDAGRASRAILSSERTEEI